MDTRFNFLDSPTRSLTENGISPARVRKTNLGRCFDFAARNRKLDTLEKLAISFEMCVTSCPLTPR